MKVGARADIHLVSRRVEKADAERALAMLNVIELGDSVRVQMACCDELTTLPLERRTRF